MSDIKNAIDFVNKYGDKRIDADLIRPGLQNDKYSLEEVAKDYASLATDEERYVVFELLKSNDDLEILRNITHLSPLTTSAELFKYIQDFKTKLHASVSEDLEDKNVWSNRLFIAQAFFTIGESMRMIPENSNLLSVDQFRASVYGELKKIYQATGREYFNSDSDVIIDATDGAREFMFDSMDVDPYDKNYATDFDNDGIPSSLDPNDHDPNILLLLADGKTLHKQTCDITKHGDKYEIKIKIFLDASDCADKKTMAQVNDLEFRQALAVKIMAFYAQYRDKDAEKIDLIVEFVDNPNDAQHRVYIRKPNDSYYRVNSIEWEKTTFDDPRTALHETLHLLGLPDYYYETTVDGGYRDNTIRPGFSAMDEDNIMNFGGIVTRGKEIMRAAAKSEINNYQKYETVDPDAILRIEFSQLLMNSKKPDQKKLQMLYLRFRNRVKEGSSDPDHWFAMSYIKYLLGEKAKGAQLFDVALKRLSDVELGGIPTHAIYMINYLTDVDKPRAIKLAQAYHFCGKLVPLLLSERRYNDFVDICKDPSMDKEYGILGSLMDKYLHGQKDKAREEIISIARSSKLNGHYALYYLKKFLMDVGEYELTRSVIETTHNTSPSKFDTETLTLYLDSLRKDGHIQTAFAILEECIRNDPASLACRAEAVKNYVFVGDYMSAANAVLEMFAIWNLYEGHSLDINEHAGSVIKDALRSEELRSAVIQRLSYLTPLDSLNKFILKLFSTENYKEMSKFIAECKDKSSSNIDELAVCCAILMEMADFRNDAEVLFSYVYDKYNRAIKEGRGFDCKSFNYALRGLAKYAIRNGDYKKAKEVLTVLWNEYQDNQMDVSEVMNLATKIGDYKLAAIAFIRFTRFYSDPEKRYNLLDFYIPEVTRLPLNRTEAIKFRRMIDSQKPAQKVLEYFDRYVLNRPS